MSKNEDGEDPLGDFIEGLVPGFLTGYVFFATYVDEDGDVTYWGDTMQGQTVPTSLGLIMSMKAIEEHQVVVHHFGTGDG